MQAMKDGPARESARWKWTLLLLCGLALVAIVFKMLDVWGFSGERPWFGYWDATFKRSGPYVATVGQPRHGGAAERAGLRLGDRIDFRELEPVTRIWVFWQPASRPVTFLIHRGAHTLPVTLTPSSVYEGAAALKFPQHVLALIAFCVFLFCALLIALRRSGSFEGRILALILIFWIFQGTSPGSVVVPSGEGAIAMFMMARTFAAVALFLLVHLCSRFGVRTSWRRALEWLAYTMIAGRLAGALLLAIGITTLRIDPLVFGNETHWLAFGDLTNIAIVVIAMVAVSTTTPSQRPRAAWLILPLPIGFAATATISSTSSITPSWFIAQSITVLTNLALLLAALAVTYALLKRRVVDIGFVLSRSIAVAIVSLIVVSAFVLMEWLLGTILADVSHATGLIANAGLALVLGVSLRFIHRRVDIFVDAVMFRKRYEDERALRDFSKEAAFVTNREALLDQALAKLLAHTDARTAGIFLQADGVYHAVRSSDGTMQSIDENDPAILALKTWHKPLDPHHFASALHGDLALPMIARGQLLGVILCGQRFGGEAYAPDDMDALAVFSQGIGSAYDSLDGSGMQCGGAGVAGELEARRESVEQSFAAVRGERS